MHSPLRVFEGQCVKQARKRAHIANESAQFTVYLLGDIFYVPLTFITNPQGQVFLQNYIIGIKVVQKSKFLKIIRNLKNSLISEGWFERRKYICL